MNTAACLVGNSSSGIREGAYIGTPVVNIGSRQNNRISGQNVLNCEPNHIEIINAIKDRVNSVNAKLKNSNGEHSLFVDPKCRQIITSLERMVYKPGTSVGWAGV